MAKVVLTTKVSPSYDDLPESRYHFPKRYLHQIEQAIGDLVVYYEPRRTHGDQSGGRQSYYAVAKLHRIEPDKSLPDHYYAFVVDYLEFDHAVPFRVNQHYFESILKRGDGETNKGAFGRAVRIIPENEFDAIWKLGFAQAIKEAPAAAGALEVPQPFERPIIERIVSRPFRDAAFAVAIKDAYKNTCAVSGLKILSSSGRAEAQAAHIQPVSKNGPDSLRNGLALSSTIHWMFDAGLISIADDYSILVAEKQLSAAAIRLINQDRRLQLPERDELKPHPHYLGFHRKHIFKP